MHPQAPTPEAEKPAALPAHPIPAAPPAPLAVPPREPAKGEVFTRALIKIMDNQVNGTWFGWRPNSIVFGKLGLTDNVNNIQLGVLEVARRTIVVMNENMTRFATTEAYNPQVNEAMNFFMVATTNIGFPRPQASTGKPCTTWSSTSKDCTKAAAATTAGWTTSSPCSATIKTCWAAASTTSSRTAKPTASRCPGGCRTTTFISPGASPWAWRRCWRR